MDPYRLFVYGDDGRLIGPATVVHAANDAEAVAQPEATSGPFDAELLDIEGLRIVKTCRAMAKRHLRLPSEFRIFESRLK